MNEHPTKPTGKQYWLDEPRHIDWLVYGLWFLCALMLLADFFYTKHAHFGFDGWFGFHAFFGFLAYCLIVLSAKQLRRVVKRDEGYYRDDDPLMSDTDDQPDDHGHPPHG